MDLLLGFSSRFGSGPRSWWDGAVAYVEATDSGALGYVCVREADRRGRSSSSFGFRVEVDETTDSGRFLEVVDSALFLPLCEELSLLFPVNLLHMVIVLVMEWPSCDWAGNFGCRRRAGSVAGCVAGGSLLQNMLRLQKSSGGTGGYQAKAVGRRESCYGTTKKLSLRAQWSAPRSVLYVTGMKVLLLRA